MSRASVRAYFMLLGGAVVAPAYVPPVDPPSDTGCLPYTQPNHLAANINLTDLLVRVDHLAANANLCEEVT